MPVRSRVPVADPTFSGDLQTDSQRQACFFMDNMLSKQVKFPEYSKCYAISPASHIMLLFSQSFPRIGICNDFRHTFIRQEFSYDISPFQPYRFKLEFNVVLLVFIKLSKHILV